MSPHRVYGSHRVTPGGRRSRAPSSGCLACQDRTTPMTVARKVRPHALEPSRQPRPSHRTLSDSFVSALPSARAWHWQSWRARGLRGLQDYDGAPTSAGGPPIDHQVRCRRKDLVYDWPNALRRHRALFRRRASRRGGTRPSQCALRFRFPGWRGTKRPFGYAFASSCSPASSRICARYPRARADACPRRVSACRAQEAMATRHQIRATTPYPRSMLD